MGKNKLKKFAEMADFPHVFQPSFEQLKSEGFNLKGRWNELFFKNSHPIVLELGCGRGEYAVGLAKLFPEKNFIGIDIKGARMWAGAKQSEEEKLSNVAFLRTVIEQLDSFFAPEEVSEIWITFPDPQMKKVRKRLTSTRFIQLYQRILRPDGLLHLKSDSPFMYGYTRAMAEANGFVKEVDTDNLYQSGMADEILSIKTAYERQWLERGMNIRYLRIVVTQKSPLVEPEIKLEPDEYRSFGRSRRSQQTSSDLLAKEEAAYQ